MRYVEVKKANTDSLKAFGDTKATYKPRFKFQVKGIDFDNELCLINGEWQDIRQTLVNILNRRICITNIRVFKGWRGFDPDIKIYADSDLEKETNKVLYASSEFYTYEAMREIVHDASDDEVDETELYDVFNDYNSMDYDDLCDNMAYQRVGSVLVLMRVKTWQGIRYGYKVIQPRSWRDILGAYSCDSFAYYLDRYNLLFKGYHHDSDCTPNRGILREIKPDVNLTDDALQKIVAAFEKGEEGAILSRYTRSLRPHFVKVFGFK